MGAEGSKASPSPEGEGSPPTQSSKVGPGSGFGTATAAAPSKGKPRRRSSSAKLAAKKSNKKLEIGSPVGFQHNAHIGVDNLEDVDFSEDGRLHRGSVSTGEGRPAFATIDLAEAVKRRATTVHKPQRPPPATEDLAAFEGNETDGRKVTKRRSATDSGIGVTRPPRPVRPPTTRPPRPPRANPDAKSGGAVVGNPSITNGVDRTAGTANQDPTHKLGTRDPVVFLGGADEVDFGFVVEDEGPMGFGSLGDSSTDGVLERDDEDTEVDGYLNVTGSDEDVTEPNGEGRIVVVNETKAQRRASSAALKKSVREAAKKAAAEKKAEKKAARRASSGSGAKDAADSAAAEKAAAEKAAAEKEAAEKEAVEKAAAEKKAAEAAEKAASEKAAAEKAAAEKTEAEKAEAEKAAAEKEAAEAAEKAAAEKAVAEKAAAEKEAAEAAEKAAAEKAAAEKAAAEKSAAEKAAAEKEAAEAAEKAAAEKAAAEKAAAEKAAAEKETAEAAAAEKEAAEKEAAEKEAAEAAEKAAAEKEAAEAAEKAAAEKKAAEKAAVNAAETVAAESTATCVEDERKRATGAAKGKPPSGTSTAKREDPVSHEEMLAAEMAAALKRARAAEEQTEAANAARLHADTPSDRIEQERLLSQSIEEKIARNRRASASAAASPSPIKDMVKLNAAHQRDVTSTSDNAAALKDQVTLSPVEQRATGATTTPSGAIRDQVVLKSTQNGRANASGAGAAPVDASTPIKDQVVLSPPQHRVIASPSDGPLDGSGSGSPNTTDGGTMPSLRKDSTTIRGVAVAKQLAGMIKNVKFQTVEEILARHPEDDVWEDLDDRAIDAAQWTDRTIRQLIEEIKARGTSTTNGEYEITFGTLFYETDNIFDAIVGLLKTAKKYEVVKYPGEHLWQGKDDNVVITLVKSEHPGIKIKRRRKTDLTSSPTKQGAKTSGFDHSFEQNAKCCICTKTVYQAEYVGAGGKTYHKACFRCTTCDKMLKQADYCVSRDGGNRCNKCHKEFEVANF